MTGQIPFGADAGFAENPENRCPCVLLLDVSGSMAGEPIAALNDGVAAFKDSLAADSLAMKRVEVAIVTFGGHVETLCDFTTADQFQPPTLTTGGNTPMGAAILKGLEMVVQRKATYKANAIAYYRPWIFLITDGGPTDEWAAASAQVKQGEASKAFAFFSVGAGEANFDVLKQISGREPLKLKGLAYRTLFNWLSSSLSAVSRSKPGDAVPLANPTGPNGWASV